MSILAQAQQPQSLQWYDNNFDHGGFHICLYDHCQWIGKPGKQQHSEISDQGAVEQTVLILQKHKRLQFNNVY